MGALFHQFIGVPISLDNVELLEKAMESCIKLQPYVISAKVKIDREKLKKKLSSYGYTTLDGEMLYAEVIVKVGDEVVEATLRWDENKKYPIMEVVQSSKS